MEKLKMYCMCAGYMPTVFPGSISQCKITRIIRTWDNYIEVRRRRNEEEMAFIKRES